jgi:hypothetical protein
MNKYEKITEEEKRRKWRNRKRKLGSKRSRKRGRKYMEEQDEEKTYRETGKGAEEKME